MKILSIQLHPFGATQDRTIRLSAGLNVIEGPNEFGKSTLGRALWNALFTPTNLTPAKSRDLMKRCFPYPNGDHAQVTVCFEAAGDEWKIFKRWGANACCELSSKRTSAIADANTVHEKLQNLCKLDLATWQKVLFINQAELVRTLELLRDNKESINNVHSFLQGAAAIPGDIPEEKLVDALAKEIKKYYSRWDLSLNGPDQGRGIQNPWKKEVGLLLEQYYKKELIRDERDRVQKHERELDAVNSTVTELQKKEKQYDQFVSSNRPLLEGLKRREFLEIQKKQAADRDKVCMEILVVWPSISTTIETRQAELKQLEESLSNVNQEKKIALERQRLEQSKRMFEEICIKRNDWEGAGKKLAETKKIDESSVKELTALEQSLREVQIKIEAQKLAARLESRSPTTVTVKRGDQAEETLAIAPEQPWDGEAAGQISIATNDLTVTIKNAQEDVDTLFESKRDKMERRNALLETIGLTSLESVRDAHKEYQDAARELETKKRIYESSLQKKTFEQWKSEVAEFDSLEQTRSVVKLDEEIQRLMVSTNEKSNALKADREKIDRWERDHTNVESLMVKTLEEKRRLGETETELQGLPTLPEGFASINEFALKVQDRESSLKRIKEEFQDAKVKKATLEATQSEKTSEELNNESVLAEESFARLKQDAESLRRIDTKLKEIIAQRGNLDPLRELREAIAKQLQVLTDGRYREVKLEGAVPAAIDGERELSALLLSQGTLGSLALATRLALAELYTKEQDGFLLLDDPMTDMDPQRRAAAAKALSLFAGNCQVLYFTCHPEHRLQLELHGANPYTAAP